MKLEGVQAGRAIAALMVVAFHANVFIIPDRLSDGEHAGVLFNFGYAGVEFFFVLSGFIMVFVHQKDFSVPDQVGSFMSKRVLRIYPIYWVIYLSLTALYFIEPGRGPEHARDLDAIIGSLLLVPMPEPPVMLIAWTLQHEMFFYLVFTLLVIDVRLGTAVFAVWMTGCVVASLWWQPGYPWSFILSFHNVLFLFGIAAAFLYRRLTAAQAQGLVFGGAAVFLCVGLSEVLGVLDWDKALRTWCYGIAAAAVVAGLAAGVLSPPRWLVFLGDASYAIYLVHLPAMTIGVMIAGKLGAPWSLPPEVLMLLLLVYAAIAGSLTHLLVERPLAALLQPRRHASVPRPGRPA
ncbi:MAG: acyltransferase [Pseudomonadota bacterium]